MIFCRDITGENLKWLAVRKKPGGSDFLFAFKDYNSFRKFGTQSIEDHLWSGFRNL